MNPQMNRRLQGKVKRVRGQGGFFSDTIGKALRTVRDLIPDKALGKALAWTGGEVGDGITGLIKGLGDYTIRKNSIILDMPVDESGNVDTRFSFAASGQSVIRVKKREYLGKISAPSARPELFAQSQYRLQATNPQTFPWASTIAELYTEWNLMGGVFSFETTSSNYTANLGLGTIAMATQYNANMLPYSDMDSVLQSAFHTRGNPSETLLHGIECDPALQSSERLFTRRPGAAGPPNLYDHGVLTVCTEGLPAGSENVTLGRLFFTYDMELSLPELPVRAPWMDSQAVSSVLANSAMLPPLGPSLNQSASAASSMTISSSTGSNIILLGPASGPLVQPTQTPAESAELMAWMNDSSGNTRLQYLSFARAGHYELDVIRVDIGGSAFVVADTVIAALSSTTVTTTFWPYGATDFFGIWRAHVVVSVAGGSITIANANAVADSGAFTLTEVQ